MQSATKSEINWHKVKNNTDKSPYRQLSCKPFSPNARLYKGFYLVVATKHYDRTVLGSVPGQSRPDNGRLGLWNDDVGCWPQANAIALYLLFFYLVLKRV